MLGKVRSAAVLRKMPAPKKKKDGPKQIKAPPPKPTMTIMEVKKKYFNALPPLPRYEFPDERCFVAELRRPKHALSSEEVERRVLIDKEYSRYMSKYWHQVQTKLKTQLAARSKALEHLEAVSPLLYKSAITFDYTVLPYQSKGLKESLPKESHYPSIIKEEVKVCNEESVKSTLISEKERLLEEKKLAKLKKGKGGKASKKFKKKGGIVPSTSQLSDTGFSL